MQNEQISDTNQKKRKIDRRTLYTKKMILDSYIKLINEKPRSKITITEICKLAEINRCTFYLHFADIKDIENAIKQKMLDEVKNFVRLQESKPDNRLDLSYKFIDKMLHDDTFMTLISLLKHDSLNFAIEQEFFQYFVSMSVPVNNHLSEREIKLLYSFITGGIVATFQFWFESGVDHLKEENLFLDQLVRSVMPDSD